MNKIIKKIEEMIAYGDKQTNHKAISILIWKDQLERLMVIVKKEGK